MNIAPIAAASIPPIQLNALAAVDSKLALLNPAMEVAQLDQNASVVDFSTLARLLSATRIFQAQQVQQAQQVRQNSLTGLALNGTQTGGDTSTDFGQLVTTANLFVDAFNQFQTSNFDNLTSLYGARFNNALLLAIHAQSGGGKSFIASLADVGINFQEAADANSPSQFNIDPVALQAAYNANPAGTSALLAKALQALSAIEVKLLAQNLSFLNPEVNSPLPGTALSSQFDVNVIASQMSSLSSADARSVSVALQRLLADEALSSALDANPVAPQSVAASPASPAKVLDEVNPNTAVPASTTGAASTTNTIAAISKAPVAADLGEDNPVTTIAPGEHIQASTTPSPVSGNSLATPSVNSANAASVISAAGNPLAGAPESLSTASPASVAGNVNAPTSAAANPMTPLAGNPVEHLAADATANTIDAAALAEANTSAVATGQTTVVNPATVTINQAISTPLASDTGLAQLQTGSQSKILAPAPQSSVPAVAARSNIPETVSVATAHSSDVPALPVSTFVIASGDNAANVNVGNVSDTQMHLPFVPINPLMAAAVAAYRLGDVIVNTPKVEAAQGDTDAIAAVEGINRVQAIALDLHAGSGDAGRNQAGRNALQTSAQSELFSEVQASLPAQSVVDVSV